MADKPKKPVYKDAHTTMNDLSRRANNNGSGGSGGGGNGGYNGNFYAILPMLTVLSASMFGAMKHRSAPSKNYAFVAMASTLAKSIIGSVRSRPSGGYAFFFMTLTMVKCTYAAAKRSKGMSA